MTNTALMVRPAEGTDLRKLYPPEEFTLLTAVAIYTNPPPYMQRKVVPVPVTKDDYHFVDKGKMVGQVLRAATWYAKVAAAMGWEEDVPPNSGLVKDWPTKRDPNDARYEMRGWLVLDQGRTYVQAAYTWDYQARAAVHGVDSDRLKEEMQWKDAKCETGALSRIIKKTLGVKATCTKDTAAKPVVVVRTEPDLQQMIDDPVIGPEVKRGLARRAFGATAMLFGGPRVLGHEVLPQGEPLALGDGSPEDEEEDEEAADVPEGVDPETGEITEPADQGPPPEDDDELTLPACSDCNVPFEMRHGEGDNSGKTWWACPKCGLAITEKKYETLKGGAS